MHFVKRDQLHTLLLPGRTIQKAVGKESEIHSQKMTMGFAHYSKNSGPMEPHHHAEEIVYVISSEKGRVRYGATKEELTNSLELEAGMTLHFPELEYHVFEYEEEGHVDIIFFYGQVDNIRPEEILEK